YAVSFSGESGLQKAGLCGIHPLTQRYVSNGESSTWQHLKSSLPLLGLCWLLQVRVTV
ncbi:TPA: DUF3265 domain-containing protein, partial [Vibrio vulnificus]|nr:DUF3265 domain-containing protein [Vibrio vulnificus]